MAKSDPNRDSNEANATASKANSVTFAPLDLKQPELSGGDLGTLQEILFGKQLVSQTNQISSLQSHVEDQLAKLQLNCDQQFAELHRKLDEGLSGVSLQLEQNNKSQTNALAETNDGLSAAESRLLTQLTQANDSSSKVQRQFETQLKKANDQLTQSMQSSREDIIARLEKAIAELHAQKLDKGALSSLLGDVATQLTNQPNS